MRAIPRFLAPSILKSSQRGKFAPEPYEVHASSWKRYEDGSLYTLRDLQRELIPYVNAHVR